MRAFVLAGILWRYNISDPEHCMEPKSQPAEPRSFFRGAAGLLAAVAVVLVLLIWLPAYRWFFLISLGIGLVVAAILYSWHQFKPVREEDIERKRPLGLD
jgi:fatty acid desaturase